MVLSERMGFECKTPLILIHPTTITGNHQLSLRRLRQTSPQLLAILTRPVRSVFGLHISSNFRDYGNSDFA